MNYDRPELGGRLAADYVLGLMPPSARRRFERAMAGNATLAAIVAGWSDRLTPLDAMTPEETPPAHVWRAIERRVGPGLETAPRKRAGIRVFWSAFAATAVTGCAALALYAALSPVPLSQTIEAVADRVGLPGSAIPAAHSPADIGLSTMNIGVSERERPRWIRAALLLTGDALTITTGSPPQSH